MKPSIPLINLPLSLLDCLSSGRRGRVQPASPALLRIHEVMGCGAMALFGPCHWLSFAHCNLPSPLTLQIITAPLKPLGPGSGLGYGDGRRGMRSPDSEMLMALMDDFQWRRTDGALRGDGGGLGVGEGWRCVADKCLNFYYYSNFVFGFAQSVCGILFLQLTAYQTFLAD